MLPTFDLETYQDVKKNLSWVGAGVLWLVALVIYLAVLPPAHREAVNTAAASIPEWASLSVLAVCTVVAGLLFGVLMIHDDLYDAYVIRWRERYDCDFLIPNLIAPMRQEVHPNFMAEARKDRSEVMYRLFYPFARDREGLVSKNARVRFYECVQRYWMTQIVEMALLLLLFVTLLYGVVYIATSLDPTTLLWVLLFAIGLFVANRWLRQRSVPGIKAATLEEIAEIHRDHQAALNDRVAETHAYLGLAYPYRAP